MSAVRSLALAIVSIGAAAPAWAWGDFGHKVVATIAYERLKPATRAKVDALLAADKDPLTARDFVSRATWADRYRDQDRNTTKKQYYATRRWHFVDIELDGGSLEAACPESPPPSAEAPASSGPAEACVVDRIEAFAAELRNPQVPRAEKQKALKFIIHFVGDLHQPLHAADHHDSGGNEVKVLYDHRTEASSLHSYWDTRVVEAVGSNVQQAVASLKAKTITNAKAAQWRNGAPADWAQESFAAARDVAYNFEGLSQAEDEHNVTCTELDANYLKRALPVARAQLAKAGIRLAAVLDGALK